MGRRLFGGARISRAWARLGVGAFAAALAVGAVGSATPGLVHAASAPSTGALASPGARGVSFELNQGQTSSSVKFLTRNAQYPLFLTADSAVFVLTDPQTVADPTKLTGPIKGDVVSVTNAGANSNVQVTGLDPVAGKTNYVIGKDKSKWQTGIASYARVQYTGIYPGIDLVYYGAPNGSVEYDYVVSPGADVGVIAADVAGADHVSVDRNGALSISTSVGTITEHKPAVYQTINGKKKSVSGGYRSLGGNRVGFSIGSHDASQPVVIDPVLSYSTYLGGNIGQNIGSPGTGTAVDSSGHQYVVGYTFAPDFPTTPGAFQTSKFGDPTSRNFQNTLNAFITKFSPDGSSLVYSTYLGGTGLGFFTGDYGYGIAVDGSGDAFVTGATTSDDFPVTGNAFQPNRGTTCASCFNAFLTEFNPSGSSLVYSSYLGGHSNNGGRNEGGRSVAVDSSGHVYVAGLTQSSDFPTTANALQRTCPSECAVNTDGVSTSGSPTYTSAGAFFIFFDAGSSISGTNIPANSCINSVVDATTITLGDCSGNPVNATGTGSGLTFTMGDRSRVQMGFFARFDPTASAAASVTYSTLLGGGGGQSDGAFGVAVDDSGEAYVTGTALSYDFPTTAGAFQTTCPDCAIHTDGVTQSGSTTFTSASAQFGPFDVGERVIAANVSAGTTVAAVTSPTQLTLSVPAEASGTGLKYQVGFSRAGAAFVVKLNPAASGQASLVFGTFLGGAGGVDADTGFFRGTSGAGIAVDHSRRTIYVNGTTEDFDFPTTSGVISGACGGGSVLPCGQFPTFGDGVTTVGSTTLTSATANFQLSTDQYASIAGSNLAPGTTISDVPNSTTVTLSQPATGTGTASFQLEDRTTSSDQFVTKLDPSGASLTYSTFLGGPSSQIGASQATGQTGGGIAIDAAGDAYVTGVTVQPDFPLKDPVAPWGGGVPASPAQNWQGADDVTVSELAPNAKSLVYSTTLGGNSLDEPAGIALDSSGAAYITGNTKSPTFPTTPLAFKPVYGGRINAFAAKIAPVSAALPLITRMSATHGPTGGGTTDVLTGHGFTGATAVTFGGVPAAFHVDSATQITVTSPPQPTAAWQMDVTVTTPAGASPANPIDRFDQGDGQWAAAQPLGYASEGPTATLLKNGKVLVVGGSNSDAGSLRPDPRAQIYDPAAGTWTPTDPANDARGLGSIATLLNDGRVLLIGKALFYGDTSAEIYDPGTGHWTTVAPANSDHTDGAAALLSDGRVLAVGGDFSTSAEVYDPGANTWTVLSSPVSGFGLSEPSLTRLNDGRVLLAGGSGGGFNNRSTAEIFDPSSNSWSATGSMNVPHAGAASVLLSDGRVLVAGGMQTRGVIAVSAEEIFDPASGTWALSGLLRQPRSGATATLLPNSKVLVAGGLVESDDFASGPLDSAELFDPAAPLQQGIADDLIAPRGVSTPNTQQKTFSAVLLSSDTTSFKSDPAVCGTNCGKVLVVGGSYDNSAELYSPPQQATSASDGGTWAAPINLTAVLGSGTTADTPDALDSGSQQLVFWRGTNNHLFEAWKTPGIGWTGPVDYTAQLGGTALLASSPDVVLTPTGQQLVFWQGTNNHLWEAWFTPNLGWSGPVDYTAQLGGTGLLASAPAIALTPSGQQLAFWRGTNNHLWEAWFTPGIGWSGPVDYTTNLGGAGPLGSAPRIVLTPSGQQLAFWQGTDNHLWEAWFTPGIGWSGPVDYTAQLGGTGALASQPSVMLAASGQQLAFWQGTNNHLWEAWFTPGIGWSGPVDYSAQLGTGGGGTLASAPALVLTPGGEQKVFWRGANDHLWEAWFTPALGWNGPSDLSAGNLNAPAGAGLAGEPDVYQDGATTRVVWQGGSNNIWEASES